VAAIRVGNREKVPFAASNAGRSFISWIAYIPSVEDSSVHTRQRCREIFATITMLVTVLLVLALTGCAGLSRGAAGDPPASSPVSGAFGFDIHNALTSWPTEPFHWWRLWDAGVDWSRVEPSANQFDFSLMDQYVALARNTTSKSSTCSATRRRGLLLIRRGPARKACPAELRRRKTCSNGRTSSARW
jgi:hypothetical protein